MDNCGWQISNGLDKKPTQIKAKTKVKKYRREELEEILDALHQLQLDPPAGDKTFWVLTDERNVMLATSDLTLKKWKTGKPVTFKKASWIDENNIKIHQEPIIVHNIDEFKQFVDKELTL